MVDGYYHVYNRGVNKQKIFLNDDDYRYFSYLFSRHLSLRPLADSKHRDYVYLRDQVEILAYCWMPNHFHLMVHQITERGLVKLMMSVCTAYTVYFNKKYKRRGPLFENNYRASLISDELYLQHLSRYIHLNLGDYKKWPYSSYIAIIGDMESPEWLLHGQVLDWFNDSVTVYKEFVSDYEEAKKILDVIKNELADNL